jgi:hypothetical protein
MKESDQALYLGRFNPGKRTTQKTLEKRLDGAQNRLEAGETKKTVAPAGTERFECRRLENAYAPGGNRPPVVQGVAYLL